MFGWFRKYVRKIGVFGVEVEFHPPAEQQPVRPPGPAPLPPAPPPPLALVVGGHGSESVSFKKWPPTPEVIAIRARYKDLIWAAGTVEEIKRLLGEYWHEEQAAFHAAGDEGWSDEAKAAFFRAAAQVNDRRKGINVIEGVQQNRY